MLSYKLLIMASNRNSVSFASAMDSVLGSTPVLNIGENSKKFRTGAGKKFICDFGTIPNLCGFFLLQNKDCVTLFSKIGAEFFSR